MAKLIPDGWYGSADARPVSEPPPDDFEQWKFTRSGVADLLGAPLGEVVRYAVRDFHQRHCTLLVRHPARAFDAKLTPNIRASELCGTLVYGVALLIEPDDRLER